MPSCKNCGWLLPDDADYCMSCGAPVKNIQQQPVSPQASTPEQATVFPQTSEQTATQPQSTVVSADNGGEALPSEKGLAWLSYVPWTPAFLVPMFVKKASEYCKYHVKQGATLWAVSITYFIIKAILLAIINKIFPGGWFYHSTVYNVSNLLLWGGNVFLFVLSIIGIVNAATGKMKELPLISKIPWVGMLLDKIYASLNKEANTAQG